MGQRFDNYKARLEKERKNHNRAISEAGEQFRNLRNALSSFDQDKVLDLAFEWDNKNDWLRLGTKCLGFESSVRVDEPKRVWFGHPSNVQTIRPTADTETTWSIEPEIDMFDEFRWKVSGSVAVESLTTEELADQAAIQLTNMAIGRSGQR